MYELAFAFCVLAVILLIHHWIIHPEYSFPDRLFQVSDVSNHETYVVAALACALTVVLSKSN